MIKFKTQFDVRGHYNQKGLHEAKKSLYSREIDTTNSIQNITEKQFSLKPLQIGFLQSLVLKDDPKFKQIQKIYAKYNADVLDEGQHAVNGLHLKTVVMDSMLKFLRMMMLAPSSEAKKLILDISYYWFIKHLNPKSQRKSKDGLLKQIKQIVSDNKLLPKQIIQQELPSQVVKGQLYEYRVKARTFHTDIDAPSFQLQNYHIHKVAYMNDKPSTAQDDDIGRRRKRLARLDYKKPDLQQYYMPPEQEAKEQSKLQGQGLAAVAPAQPVPGTEGQVKPTEGVPQQPALTPQQEQMEQMMNQMGGQPEQPEEAAVDEDEDKEKKKGKLDPFVKVFLMKQLQKQQARARQLQTQCPRIENFQRLKNNYKQQLQREDENFKGYLLDWAAKKTRMKTQVNRKLQSMKAFKDMSHIKNPNKIEDVLHKTRINEAIRGGREYLKKQLNRQPLNTQGGLSCFDKRRVKTVTASSSTPKPFSQILQENKRINKRQDFLDQIEDIKQKFAKQKIYTSMQAMKNGLMHPEQKQQGDQLERVQYPTCLLSNPFFVVKKKKKKGKKKK